MCAPPTLAMSGPTTACRMTRALIRTLACSLLWVLAGLQVVAAETPPAWAFPFERNFKSPIADTEVRRVPNSSVEYKGADLKNFFFAPDWHPGDHPAMPAIVARGRKPDVYACGFCHRADGPGGPENSSLAGLPAAYIVQQVLDYKNGLRNTTVPRPAVDFMTSLSKSISDAELQAAANYFSALKPRANLEVIETDVVPKTYVAGFFLAVLAGGEQEPIAGRIIEVPRNLDQFESRDARSQFIAYVPRDSLEAGAVLVNTGSAPKTLPCATCHGADLRGVGNVPSIAGRSPSYIARQLYDIRSGARGGPSALLMQPVVAKLTIDDMTAIAAYLAARAP